MKKTQNKFIQLITLLLLFSVVSCDNYLSELPDNRAVINSPEKIKALITGAYPLNNYMLMAEIMSDNAVSKGTSNGSINEELHMDMFNWESSNDENQDTPIAYWSSCYAAIAQANQALESINELKQNGETSNLDPLEGEALLARAYAHFMLVNFWGKHYDENTAETDLGVPYVFEPETTLLQEYTRNTVKEVYDFIEADLLTGIDLVETSEVSPKFHFSKEAGHAFATRFYTFKGDWDNVILHAAEAITNPVNEIRDLVEYTDLSYGQRTARYNSSLEPSNILVHSAQSWWARNFFRTDFGLLSNSTLFNSGNPFGKNWAYDVFGGEEFANLPKFDEFFKITNQNAGTGLGFTPMVLLSKDEVLLNRAEAYAMVGNYTSSLKDITDFLSKKTINFNEATDVLTEVFIETNYPVIENQITPAYEMTEKQTSFINAILEFRQREFYHEGLRWFDVRRFNIAINRDFRFANTTTAISLEKNDPRKQLEIPKSAVDFGLTQNPR